METETVVVNACGIMTLPGHDADVRGRARIWDPLRCGLLRESFIPDRPRLILTEMVRCYKDVVREQARRIDHVYRVLEEGNLRFRDVVSRAM